MSTILPFDGTSNACSGSQTGKSLNSTSLGFDNRSPWSNEYDPPLDDGTVPSPKLRKLEITANEAFDTYREMSVMLPLVVLAPPI